MYDHYYPDDDDRDEAGPEPLPIRSCAWRDCGEIDCANCNPEPDSPRSSEPDEEEAERSPALAQAWADLNSAAQERNRPAYWAAFTQIERITEEETRS